MRIKNVSRHIIYKDPEMIHCENQVVVKQLSNGEVMAVFNEERFPVHSDTGQTAMIFSSDGGITWYPSDEQVIDPYLNRCNYSKEFSSRAGNG